MIHDDPDPTSWIFSAVIHHMCHINSYYNHVKLQSYLIVSQQREARINFHRVVHGKPQLPRLPEGCQALGEAFAQRSALHKFTQKTI